MSIENITARILKEAQDEAASMKEQARREADEALAGAKADAEKYASDMSAKAEQDAAVLKERKNSVAELESRKMRLAAKQEVIEEAFGEAEKALTQMPEDQYIDFIVSQLAGAERGEVLLSAEDKAKIGEKLAEKLSGTGLTVSEETADIAGGFILRDGKVSVNGSLKSILEAQKKQITAQVAQALFS